MPTPDKDRYLRAWRDITVALVDYIGHEDYIEDIQAGLADISGEYRQRKEHSRDNWMTKKKVGDALEAIEKSIRKCIEDVNHPQVRAHLTANASEQRACDYSGCLSHVVSAAQWARRNLDEDFAKLQQGGRPNERRTRVGVRDEFLIPALTRLFCRETDFRPLESREDARIVEQLVLLILTHWATLTGVASASSYPRIAEKRLRRLVRAASEQFSEMG